MCNSQFRACPLDLSIDELNSPHFFYKFYSTMKEASMRLDHEMKNSVGQVCLTSIDWDGHTALFRKVKNMYLNSSDDYFEDEDRPYLVYGFDATKIRRYDNLYAFLKENCEHDDMNTLVECYDAIKSRQHALDSINMSSMERTDSVDMIRKMQSIINNILYKFLDANHMSRKDVDEYDITKDVQLCRGYLHTTGRRNTYLVPK